MKIRTFLFSLFLVFSFIIIGFLGWKIYYISSLDRNVLMAEPYVKKILFNDSILREIGSVYVQDCCFNDSSCMVNQVYRNVVSKNSYELDPNNTELIRGPFETLGRKSGDCEDLAILAASILENLGIQTYLVLTKDHMYTLACGVNKEKILEYSKNSLKEIYANKFNESANIRFSYSEGEIYFKDNVQEVIKLKPQEVLYLEADKYQNFFDLNYTIYSGGEFEFYVLSSMNDLDNFVHKRNFKYYPNCSLEEEVCENLSTNSVILFFNPSGDELVLDINLDFIYTYDSRSLFANNSYVFYTIQNETCVVLETTAGEFGFVGLISEDLQGEKIAFDPRNYNYFFLG